MLFSTHPRKLLSEAAAADLLDPKVSDEVKEVIDNLEDVLVDKNIEEVKDENKTSNGGIPTVTDAVPVMQTESAIAGKNEYLVTIESVLALMETEGEKLAAEAEEVEPGEAPTPEAVEANKPHTANIIEDIANANGVAPEDISITISQEAVKYYAEMAILEAKAGKTTANNKSLKKLKDIDGCTKEALAGGINVKKSSKKDAKGKK